MSYNLGVDLGTTFVAAAISVDSQPEMVTLGDRSVVTPAVVYLREDGVLVTGEAASRRSVKSPERVGREFKRRLGDPTPVKLGGASFAVTDLLGTVLRDVLAKVSETEGMAPERVVLTHPANWGPFRRGLFEEVPRAAGLTNSLTITEPEAAAAHYAASRKLDEGEIVAVYDLGGGTFDATVLCKRGDGVEILGTPEGVERLGGIDFDEAILSHVTFAADGALTDLDMRDPQNSIALARLRQDCALAKENLSTDTEAVIPVFLPGRHFDVNITRAEFEKLVRVQIESTIGALSRTLGSARVSPDELSAVLLVGGSSRIPLVAEMVSEELGRPTVVDTHPKYAVALGAATVAGLPTSQDHGRKVGPPPGPGSARGTALRPRQQMSGVPAPPAPPQSPANPPTGPGRSETPAAPARSPQQPAPEPPRAPTPPSYAAPPSDTAPPDYTAPPASAAAPAPASASAAGSSYPTPPDRSHAPDPATQRDATEPRAATGTTSKGARVLAIGIGLITLVAAIVLITVLLINALQTTL